MSQENVEAVQHAIEAWNADDLDAFLAELDAHVEWHPAIEPGLEGRATTYRGHDGARKVWSDDRGEEWERLTNRPTRRTSGSVAETSTAMARPSRHAHEHFDEQLVEALVVEAALGECVQPVDIGL